MEALLFKDVRKGPEAIAVDQAVNAHDGAHDEGSRVGLVVKGVAQLGGAVPLCEVERAVAGCLSCLLRLLAHDVPRHLGELLLDRLAGVGQRIVGIGVGADKIDRHVILLTKVEEGGDPGAGRGGWAADLYPRLDVFQSTDGDLVEPEVLLLSGGPELLAIWLVPHFEEPARHFVRSVALDPVPGEAADETPPRLIVVRRRNIGVIGEGRLIPGGQRTGHEAQLDPGAHPHVEQEVDDLIGIEKGVLQRLLSGVARGPVTEDGVHHAGEDAVKAHALEAEIAVGVLELDLPVTP